MHSGWLEARLVGRVLMVLALCSCSSPSDLGGAEDTGGLPNGPTHGGGTGGAPGAGGTTSLPADRSLDAEEEAVYAALLAEEHRAAFYVIQAQTAVNVSEDYPLDQLLVSLLESFPELSSETTASYQARNATAHPVSPNLNIGAPYVIITDEELNPIFMSGGDGWQRFYAIYPGAPGTIQLSRVGFNWRLDQALLYVGQQWGDLAGEGIYYVMQKSAAGWQLTRERRIWIS